MDLTSGKPFPMGATLDSQGTNFAVYSTSAAPGAIQLCLFDEAGGETQIPLTARTGNVWHVHVSGIRAGQRYGYRMSGPWEPDGGLWANPAKLLLDPWSKAIDGRFDADESVVTHAPGNRDGIDTRDSAPHVPRSVVVDPSFDWRNDKPLGVPLSDLVLYETHVRGLTMRHPHVPETQRGTYAGLASPPVIDHLTALGVNAVELMPVHHFVPEMRLLQEGRTNYWGYSSIGFFAPHAAYSSSGSRGQQVNEFKAMVAALHAAGIEVILDVVFNHTAEGTSDGPTLAYRGLDNPTYYRLAAGDPRSYVDYTGTGNTLDTGEAEVLRIIASSLRYWVTDMHVDGFRFDLASALARDTVSVDRASSFLDLLYQDPALTDTKLIAEPWDTGDGYFLGHFPPPWGEWNDRYRGGVRDYWRAQTSSAELATRLAGSRDVFQAKDLTPDASINYLAAHDGFTLTDLVSYNGKHNEANGEDNRDGSNDNRSWNCGAEGPTDNQDIVALRARQRRNFLATLLFSQGVPMILGGDEIGRTQQGNNNAYCQDNEISWYDWNLDQERQELLEFSKLVIGLRRAHPVFRRRVFLTGEENDAGLGKDVEWFSVDGTPMTDERWGSGTLTVGMWLNGAVLLDPMTCDPQPDDTFLLLCNAWWEPQPFSLPDRRYGVSWVPVVDSVEPTGVPARPTPVLQAGTGYTLAPRSLLLLRRTS
ncbi:glycogen debranching protein GlgX [Actinophytocola sp.]|uniref:glycogen debranching protein GlgX n=1 Tax=Actinophytocola sp. TaxID=1872138 RepID=UPI002ED4D898